MVKNERMAQEQYEKLKYMLYDLVSQYDRDKLLEYFATKVTYKTQEEKDIVINTILYPEDIRILDELTYLQGEEKISYKLGIPVEFIRAKGKEFGRYKIWKLLQENEEARNLAMESANIDPMYAEDIVNRLK